MPLVVCARRRGKDGASAMTLKQKLQIHRQIVRENARKLKEWKAKRKGAAA